MRREQVAWGWGEPGAGPPFGDHATDWLRERLGVSGAVVAPPAGVVALRAPVASDALRRALAAAVGAAHVRDDDAIRALRAAGKSYLDLLALRSGEPVPAPDLVVAPAGHDECAAVLHACAEAGAAVVPFGGGTSVVGGVAPLRGRWDSVVCLDLARMDAIVAVDERARTVVVGPGRRLPELDRALAEHGLRLGHHPQSYEWATVGGCVATRSAGQASTGFGRIDELVVALRCATPLGELLAGPAPSRAAGPELRELIVGSEGVLGVITQVGLRVRPRPEERRYEGWLLRSWAAGCEALRALAQDGPTPDVARLSDAGETELALAFAGGGRRHLLAAALGPLGFRPGCLAIVGWEGEARTIAWRRRGAAQVLRRAGALPLGRRVGDSWLASRYAGPHLRDALLDRGVLVETLETAASWTALPAVRRAVTDALRTALAAPAIGCHISHLYPDGASLYFTVLARRAAQDPSGEWRAAKRAATDALTAAGGTLSHHHAVGVEHAAWMEREHGRLGLELLRAVKRRCDPAGIMNPGKLLAER